MSILVTRTGIGPYHEASQDGADLQMAGQGMKSLIIGLPIVIACLVGLALAVGSSALAAM